VRRDFSRAESYAGAARALGGPPWLSEARDAAADTLLARGFPARSEAWKYTRASTLLADVFAAPAQVGPVPQRGPWSSQPRLMFVDGALAEVAGDPAAWVQPLVGPEAPPLGAALGEVEGFGALNLAMVRGGAWVRVPDGVDGGDLHLVHTSSGGGALGAVRHLISLGEGARLRLFEHFVGGGAGAGLTSATTEVMVGADAHLEHLRSLDEGDDALHVGAVGSVVAGGGLHRVTSVVVGGRLSRVELSVRLDGADARADLHGLALLRGAQHADHHVSVDHAQPNAHSDQFFRSVLDGRSRSVYTGAVMVREGALGTDSGQLHHALLLSDDAVVNARPWLEIYADDVRCAHGAAIGSLDAESLFYLRQRGLDALGARSLLTAGFARLVLDRLSPSPVRDALHTRSDAWLATR